MGSNYIPFSELAEVNPPRALPPGLSASAEVSFISMADVSESGAWVSRQTRKLQDVLVGYTSFAEGDVLFAKITPCMENGKGAHATGLVGGIGFGSTEFHVLRARAGTEPRFIYHWAQSIQLRLRAEGAMTGSAGQQRVDAGFFSRFQVPRLSRSEQRRIAEILDTLDETILKSQQLIAKLKQVKQGLLHDLLTYGIDDSGELRDPKRHPEQFKDSVLGRIPQEWDVRPLSALAEVRSGIAKNEGRAVRDPVEVHYLRVANVQDGYLDLSEMKKIRVSRDDLDRYRVLPGDVLMNEGGDLDKLGRGAVWRGGYEPCVHQNHVFVVRCNPLLNSDFLSAWMGSPRAKAYFLLAGKQTTNLASINKTQLGRLPVLVPPRLEQDQMLMRLAAFESQLSAELETRSKLGLLKKGVSEDLLTGRVRVTELTGEVAA